MSSPLTLHGVVPLAWEWEAAGEGSFLVCLEVYEEVEWWSISSYTEFLSHLAFDIVSSANMFAGCQDFHWVPFTVNTWMLSRSWQVPASAWLAADLWDGGYASWPASVRELRATSSRLLLSCDILQRCSQEKRNIFWLAEEGYDRILLLFSIDVGSCSSGAPFPFPFPFPFLLLLKI